MTQPARIRISAESLERTSKSPRINDLDEGVAAGVTILFAAASNPH
jgi:hypothetical protein